MRTRVTAALIAALALLAWVVTPALAAAPLRLRAAHGRTAELTGNPVPFRTSIAGGPGRSATTPAPGLSGASEVALIVGGIVVLMAVAILVAWRLTARAERRTDTRGASVPRPPGPSMAELEARASHAVIQTHDAVLSSEQELGFAIARFGERAAAPFSAAVRSARAELRDAFRLRQLLDDGPADAAATQSRLAEINARCTAASSLLDDQAEAFDRLHDTAGSAPQLVAEVDTDIAQQSARLGRSRQVLGRLADKYTPDAVLAVASNPDQAAERLEFAADYLASAREELTAGHSVAAAVLLQAAEAGADQATDLLTGVQHMEAELTQAASAVPAALREVDAEIAEAGALVSRAPDEERAALLARAQAVSAEVRAKQAAGAFDALAALRDVQQADAAIDRALAGARTEQARRQRATAVLDQAMLVARSSVTAADDFVTTRRGAVGPTGRTRLAEGQRHFQQAIGWAQSDPDAALTEAQHADALAQQARALSEQDVGQFGEARAGAPGAGLRGAILGGILIDTGDGGLGPGSFGGVGTRGRHSIIGQHGLADEPGQHSRSGQHGVSDQHGVSGQHSDSGQHSVSGRV